MLAVFTAHTHTPQLPSLPSHRRPDMATSSKEKAEPLSHVSMGRVCYTQVGSWEVQIFTLCSREFVCLCAFPRPASRISSRLHFKPVAKCKLLLSPFSLGRAFSWSPSHHPYPPVWSFSIELQSKRGLKLSAKREPAGFEPVGLEWGGSCRLI